MILEYSPGGDRPGEIRHVIATHPPAMRAMLAARGVSFVEYKGRPPFNPMMEGYVAETPAGVPVLMRRPVASVSISKASIAADNQDEAVIGGLPDPCRLLVDGAGHDVAGGELRITSTMPATYEIVLDHWPFMPWSAVIVAE